MRILKKCVRLSEFLHFFSRLLILFFFFHWMLLQFPKSHHEHFDQTLRSFSSKAGVILELLFCFWRFSMIYVIPCKSTSFHLTGPCVSCKRGWFQKLRKVSFFSDCAADKTPCDGSTICLTTYDICDGWDDCADGSDEAVCGWINMLQPAAWITQTNQTHGTQRVQTFWKRSQNLKLRSDLEENNDQNIISESCA